jgi:hypothetical protein
MKGDTMADKFFKKDFLDTLGEPDPEIPKLDENQLATREALFNLITGTMTNKTYVGPFIDALEKYIDYRVDEAIHDHCIENHYPFPGQA